MQHCPRYKEATSDQDLTGGELVLSTLRQRILCGFANTGDNFIWTSILSFYFFFFFFFFCYFVLCILCKSDILKIFLTKYFFVSFICNLHSSTFHFRQILFWPHATILFSSLLNPPVEVSSFEMFLYDSFQFWQNCISLCLLACLLACLLTCLLACKVWIHQLTNSLTGWLLKTMSILFKDSYSTLICLKCIFVTETTKSNHLFIGVQNQSPVNQCTILTYFSIKSSHLLSLMSHTSTSYSFSYINL